MLVENIKIVKVGEVRNGTSTTTGKPWSNRNLLLAFEDETGESYINAVVKTADWEQMGLYEGQTVSLNLRFRTKPFKSGFIANDIRIIKTAPSNSPEEEK